MKPTTATAVPPEPNSHFVEINGLRLHYLDWSGAGDRHTFVLLHGSAAHVHWWDDVAPLLAPLGRVLALDLRGHGRSQWARPPIYGPTAYVADLIKFVERLETRVILVGHSLGGAVAQWAAIERPDLLEALIIIDAFPGAAPLWRRLLWRWRRKVQGGERPQVDSADSLIRKFRFSPPGHYLSPETLARLALAGAEQLANGRWTFRFDPETRASRPTSEKPPPMRLRRIQAPTMILRGADSLVLRRWKARSMRRRIRGAILKEIPRAFHHVPLDNPAATAAAIAEFTSALT